MCGWVQGIKPSEQVKKLQRLVKVSSTSSPPQATDITRKKFCTFKKTKLKIFM